MKKLIPLVLGASLVLAGCTGGVGGTEVPPELDVTYTKGNANAPIVITEYSDYQCPFCAKFTLEVLPDLQKEYIEDGKVLFVFKDFPLPSHQYAQMASESTYCVGEQDSEKFWDYHVKIFENQTELTKEDLVKYAEEVGVNTEAFKTCLDSRKYQSLVLRNKQEGLDAEVSATPTLFINDIKVRGLQPFDSLEKIIETELRK